MSELDEALDRLMMRYEEALGDILSLTERSDMLKSSDVRAIAVRGLAGGGRSGVYRELRNLVSVLINNDPDSLIADNGMTVYDGFKDEAIKLLAKK